MDPNDWTLFGNANTDPTTNFLGTTDNNPLIIKTNGTEALHIDVGGNVGIGTTTPPHRLSVVANFDGDGIELIGSQSQTKDVGVALVDEVGNQGALGLASAPNAFMTGVSPGDIVLQSVNGNVSLGSGPATATPTLVVSGNATVGIGTTTPGSKLDVVQANSAAMRALSGDSNSHTSLAIGRAADEGRIGVAATAGQYANDAVAGDIILRTETPSQHLLLGNGPGNSTMAIVNGNVGIGTSSPLARLQVISTSRIGAAVHAVSSGDEGIGIHAAGKLQAGDFSGNVAISGDLFVVGTKQFKIDHPLDAAKKYLYHASVESPDMKNIYDGIVMLDAQGEAEVTLPVWFDALNTDFRYQLTAIGAAGPDLHIAEETSVNRFKIAGGKPQMKVCWQVTGIRQDAWARAHPLSVEQDKPTQEQGHYLHPELYGESDEKSIARARYPEIMQQL